MSKITITRLMEISKALQTEAGQQLVDVLQYLQGYVEQTLRALRGGLTFSENFKCDVLSVELENGTGQIVQSENPSNIYGVLPLRSVSVENFFDSFGWYINDDNELVVQAEFVGAPTDPVTCTILVLYV